MPVKNILSYMLFVGTMQCFSQIANIPGVGNEVLKIKKYEGVVGSPFLYDDWKSATVIDRNGRRYDNALVKYDIYEDIVEVLTEGKIMQLSRHGYPLFEIVFTDPSNNRTVTHRFKSGSIKIDNYSPTAYFEELWNGRIEVVRKFEVKFIQDVVSSYGTAEGIKRFQRSEKYYVNNRGKFNEVKLNRKSVLSVFIDKQKELEKFITSEKLKFKSEADLIRVVEYYESIR